MKNDIISTIIVRIAVATVEFVFFSPHFTRMDVIPAKKAEPNAYITHMITSLMPNIIFGLFQSVFNISQSFYRWTDRE